MVTIYGAQYRGIVQYYLMAHNVNALSKLQWVMETSLLKTLAAKHQTTVRTQRRKYKTTTRTPSGKTLKCIEVRVERDGKLPLVARFGGISLTRQPYAVLGDERPLPTAAYLKRRSELLTRLLADTCELCGATEHIEVHHIRKLAKLRLRGRAEKPDWVKLMASRRRKTLVVCRACHMKIHYG
jgi:hypothetical protein